MSNAYQNKCSIFLTCKLEWEMRPAACLKYENRVYNCIYVIVEHTKSQLPIPEKFEILKWQTGETKPIVSIGLCSHLEAQ